MKYKAFTFLEIILVVSLMAVALGLSVLYSQSSQIRADLNTQVADFVSYARLASSNAMAGKDNSDYGIHLEENAYILFKGSSFVSGAEGNYVVTLPDTIKIQNVSLNGAGSDIIFDRPFGYTDEYGSMDFTSSQIGKTLTINIDKYGKISY